MAVRPLQRPRLRTENPAISPQILSPIAQPEPLPKVLARVSEQQPESVATPVVESEAKPTLAVAGAQIMAAGQAINKAVVNTAKDAAKSITDDVPWLKSWKVWAAAVLLLAVFGGGSIFRNLNKKPGTNVATPAKPAAKPKELATTPAADKSKLAEQKPVTTTKPVAVTKNKDLFKPTATVTSMPETLKPVPVAPRPLTNPPNTEYQAQQPQPTTPRTASKPIAPTEQLPAMSGNYPLPNPNTANMASRPIISVPGNSVTIPNNFVTQPTTTGDAHLNGMITPLPPQTLRR
jgi:hypothetical protein